MSRKLSYPLSLTALAPDMSFGSSPKRTQMVSERRADEPSPQGERERQNSESDALTRWPKMRGLEDRTHVRRLPEIARFNIGDIP